MKTTDSMKSLFENMESKLAESAKEVATLRGRITTLESMPATSGPMKTAVKSTDNPKMGNTVTVTPETREQVIKSMLNDPNTPASVKGWLGMSEAMDSMTKVFEAGPQPPR